MNFATTAALWALPAAALPLAIHLLSRRAARALPFSDMTLLAAIDARSRPRSRLRELLLLAARTLLILALVLAAAGPVARGASAVAGAEGLDLVVLLDSSYSMRARDGGRPRFEAARDAGRRLLKRLAPGRPRGARRLRREAFGAARVGESGGRGRGAGPRRRRACAARTRARRWPPRAIFFRVRRAGAAARSSCSATARAICCADPLRRRPTAPPCSACASRICPTPGSRAPLPRPMRARETRGSTSARALRARRRARRWTSGSATVARARRPWTSPRAARRASLWRCRPPATPEPRFGRVASRRFPTRFPTTTRRSSRWGCVPRRASSCSTPARRSTVPARRAGTCASSSAAASVLSPGARPISWPSADGRKPTFPVMGPSSSPTPSARRPAFPPRSKGSFLPGAARG